MGRPAGARRQRAGRPALLGQRARTWGRGRGAAAGVCAILGAGPDRPAWLRGRGREPQQRPGAMRRRLSACGLGKQQSSGPDQPAACWAVGLWPAVAGCWGSNSRPCLPGQGGLEPGPLVHGRGSRPLSLAPAACEQPSWAGPDHSCSASPSRLGQVRTAQYCKSDQNPLTWQDLPRLTSTPASQPRTAGLMPALGRRQHLSALPRRYPEGHALDQLLGLARVELVHLHMRTPASGAAPLRVCRPPSRRTPGRCGPRPQAAAAGPAPPLCPPARWPPATAAPHAASAGAADVQMASRTTPPHPARRPAHTCSGVPSHCATSRCRQSALTPKRLRDSPICSAGLQQAARSPSALHSRCTHVLGAGQVEHQLGVEGPAAHAPGGHIGGRLLRSELQDEYVRHLHRGCAG